MRGIWSIGAIFLLASISGAYAQVGTYIISATNPAGRWRTIPVGMNYVHQDTEEDITSV